MLDGEVNDKFLYGGKDIDYFGVYFSVCSLKRLRVLLREVNL